jgi:predicted O-methyltransferase YrrM
MLKRTPKERAWRSKPVRSFLQESIRVFKVPGLRRTAARLAVRLRVSAETATATAFVRAQSRQILGIEDSLDFAFGFSVGSVSIAPAQIRSEIADLLATLASNPPQRMLEVGTARGGTLFLFSRVADANAGLVTIDLPKGPFGGGYGRDRVPLLKALPRGGQTLKLIRSDSHAFGTLTEVRRWFGDEPLDFVFIDGDHAYDGVRRDFMMYGPLVRPSGLIAIHDIVPGRQDRVGGVPRFWQEIASVSDNREFVRDWNQGGFGIGVVELPATGFDSCGFTR